MRRVMRTKREPTETKTPADSKLDAPMQALVDEEREQKYIYKLFALDKVISSPCGRFLLFSWIDEYDRYDGDAISLVDTYSNSRIIFQMGVCYTRIVALYEDLRCIIQRNDQLLWLQLDATARTTHILGTMGVLIEGDAIVLDDSGCQFFVQNDEEFAIYELENEIFMETEMPKFKCRTLSRHPLHEYVHAARLSPSGKHIWLTTFKTIWRLQLSDLSLREFPFSEGSPLKLMVEPGRWSKCRFVDGEHLIGIVSARIPLLHSRHAHPRLYRIRLNEETGAELCAEYSLEPAKKWKYIISIICSPSSIRVQLPDQVFAHIQTRRPESLLVTAHMAAMNSKQQFELPPVLPIQSMSGRRPKYALPKRRRTEH